MEIKILEKTNDTLEIEIIGEDHTLCNALRELLIEDDNVIFASYKIDHPLVGHPTFIVKTNGSITPEEILIKIAEKISEKALETKPKLVIPEEDVQLVANQTGKSLEEARKALEETEGDLAKAILLLQSQG